MISEEEPEDQMPPEETLPPLETALEEESVPTEETGGETPVSKPAEQLLAILEAAKSARLSPADEDLAVQLLKETITGGPKALPATLEAILALPWNAAVKAVTEAWPETKPAGRLRILTGLAKAESDAAKRIRLSLARGLQAQDAASALKLITGVCEAMGGAQGGSSTKDRQIFANVMLGKARPWIMNVSIAEMKPAEAQKLITPTLESCHQAPIFTQIWVLRWICDANQFDTLPPEHIEAIGKSVNRWQGRWHKELRKIIPKLPDAFEAALSGSGTHSAPPPVPVSDSADLEPAGETAAEAPSESTSEPPSDEDDVLETLVAVARAPRPARTSESSSHRSGRQPAGVFDLNRALRDIDAYVARLRTELQQAQAAARRREPAPERSRGRQQPAASGEEIEDMRRHNQQLEEQNEELRHRIEELTSDHEDRAATVGIGDALEQFKTYLGLKLKQDFADYSAISREALNEVVRRHAHEILGRVFAILQSEGVSFETQD
jgi:hypothetical protein